MFHLFDSPTYPHVWGKIASKGWAGVDLFFVLSGFLITGILLRSRNATNYFSAFYIRRLLRIAPLYYLCLFAILIVIPWMHRHLGTPSPASAYTWQQQILYWLNLSNLRSAFFPLEISLASIYWSLALEEQFYAVWPLCIRLIAPQRIAAICTAVILISPLLRLLPIVQNINLTHANFIYRFTPFRLDGFFMGAGMAALVHANFRPRRFSALCLALFLGGLALFVFVCHAPSTLGWFSSSIVFSALAAMFGGLVGLCARPEGILGTLISRICSISVLRAFGKYSYCIYLIHLSVHYFLAAPAMHFALTHLRSMNPFLFVAALTVIVCFVLSALSWRFIESPILRLKHLADYQAPAQIAVHS